MTLLRLLVSVGALLIAIKGVLLMRQVTKPKKKPVARRVFGLTELGKKAAKVIEEAKKILKAS